MKHIIITICLALLCSTLCSVTSAQAGTTQDFMSDKTIIITQSDIPSPQDMTTLFIQDIVLMPCTASVGTMTSCKPYLPIMIHMRPTLQKDILIGLHTDKRYTYASENIYVNNKKYYRLFSERTISRYPKNIKDNSCTKSYRKPWNPNMRTVTELKS